MSSDTAPASPPLACTVRDCGLPLIRSARAWTCPRGHAYDIARSGYINLLQPQDRRASQPGDARAAVETRARLLDAGVGTSLVETIVDWAAGLLDRSNRVIVDLGAGSGHTLAALTRARPWAGIGIDISAAAADHAAKRFPSMTWVVANADRHLPLASSTVDLVVSVHARRNPAECARILASGGTLLIAVPADDDLKELRAHLQGDAFASSRAAALIAEHDALFALAERVTVREQHALARSSLLDLLYTTYRGARRSQAQRIEELTDGDVTLSSDLFVLRKR